MNILHEKSSKISQVHGLFTYLFIGKASLSNALFLATYIDY